MRLLAEGNVVATRAMGHPEEGQTALVCVIASNDEEKARTKRSLVVLRYNHSTIPIP